MNNSIKKTSIGISALFAGQLAFATAVIPEVSGVVMTQPSNTRLTTIEYTLANAPAVITLDIQTNAHDDVWVSIGGKHIQSFSPTSDVWKKVEGNGKHYIYWRPDHACEGMKLANCRAVVKAWALDNTPDYMVCDIAAGAAANSQRYYPAEDFIPGGLLSNSDYRINKMVMRKIVAKNVAWTMGSFNEAGRGSDETTFTVTLTNNYYMGVFEVTQGQFELVMKRKHTNASYYAPSTAGFAGHLMYPVNKISMGLARWWGTSGNSYYPNTPGDNSFCYLMREITGIADFDLPSEAQWEYACRAGNGEGCWGNGAAYTGAATDSNLPGCYGTDSPANVGSYPANDWGLYDMHGNVFEFCNDWYSANITGYGGRPNINPSNPIQDLSGQDRSVEAHSATGKTCVQRGGYYGSSSADCRSANRDFVVGGWSYDKSGFRVICRAGLD